LIGAQEPDYGGRSSGAGALLVTRFGAMRVLLPPAGREGWRLPLVVKRHALINGYAHRRRLSARPRQAALVNSPVVQNSGGLCR